MEVYITVERDQLPDSKLQFLRGITLKEQRNGGIGFSSWHQDNKDEVDFYDRTDSITHTWDNSTSDDVKVCDEEGNQITFTTPD